jgi:protocatechuate 3,4-dioxygenase, alpha subunit
MMPGRTPSQTVGPYFALGLCRETQSEIVPGGPVRIVGRIIDGAGDPVPDAVVELWQPGDGGTRWGRCGTDGEGRFEFVTEKPPAGEGGAPAIDVMVFARGLLKHLVTRIYFPDEVEANSFDPVLSSLEPADRETLVAVDRDGALRFDICLQGHRQTVFFAV